MISALKRVVVPYLRDLGFMGSFPHYRRVTDVSVDLLTFQFSKYTVERAFKIEAGRCAPGGIMLPTGEHIATDELTAWAVPYESRRLIIPGWQYFGTWGWFRFGRNTVDAVAAKVLQHLKRQDLWSEIPVAQKWFETMSGR